MAFSHDGKFQLRLDDLVWREAGDELVVLELSTTTYLTLNGTARLLWEKLTDASTFDGLVEMLVERFPITADQARSDAEAFLTTLVDRDVVVRYD